MLFLMFWHAELGFQPTPASNRGTFNRLHQIDKRLILQKYSLNAKFGESFYLDFFGKPEL